VLGHLFVMFLLVWGFRFGLVLRRVFQGDGGRRVVILVLDLNDNPSRYSLVGLLLLVMVAVGVVRRDGRMALCLSVAVDLLVLLPTVSCRY
jgi:hypothetical protein